MIYITKQYLADKKEEKQENQLNIFFDFLTPPEKISCHGITDAYFAKLFFTKMKPNRS